jgi:hypothetical protein
MRADLPLELMIYAAGWRAMLESCANSFPASSDRRKQAAEMLAAFDRVMTEFAQPYDGDTAYIVTRAIEVWTYPPEIPNREEQWLALVGLPMPDTGADAMHQLNGLLQTKPADVRERAPVADPDEAADAYQMVGSAAVPKGVCIVTSRKGLVHHVGTATGVMAVPQSSWPAGAIFSFHLPDFLNVKARLEAAVPDAPKVL